jgi:GT2 family glycosyltransferase
MQGLKRNISKRSLPRIFAVTVTYSDRYKFLHEVVAEAFANGVEKVVIVDNGSTGGSRQAIRDLEQNSDGRIALVAFSQNQGSAVGFKAGLEFALGFSECEYIWLLDDDNRPDEGALAALVNAYTELRAANPPDHLAVASLRKDWNTFQQLVIGNTSAVFPRKSSFIGFHFLSQPRKIRELLHLDKGAAERQQISSPIQVPFATYGGLFFHKSLISNVGYPDERFVLYHDDTEYTYRLTKTGGKVFLVPLSILFDLEHSWHLVTKGGSVFSRLITTNSDVRTYYSVRNQVYIDRYVWGESLLAYLINKTLFLIFLAIFAVRYGRWKRFILITRAVRDGELKKLGRLRDLQSV